MNQDVLPGPNFQVVVDSLESRQSCDWDSACALQVERLRNRHDVVHVNGDVLRIKSALGIGPGIGVNAIAGLETANARSHLRDRAGAIRA